jgi:peptidoglycan/xylan/chitin deacetylase (PgdA/CDA1 family)
MFEVTLTFDDGPEPSVTPIVLDVLSRHSVLSTFFVLGHKLTDPAARACAERARAEGHWIGNHTWTHTIPLGECPGADIVQEEIERTQAEIGPLANDPPLFRPNGAGGRLDHPLLSPEAAAKLLAGGYSCVLWNSSPRDCVSPDDWVETALLQITEQPWTLMVLHDIPSGAMRHLDRFLVEVRHCGGRFRQDFPPSCVPITAGEVTGPLGNFTTMARVCS